MIMLTNGDIGLHVPKTGGLWVTGVLNRLGYIGQSIHDEHDPIAALKQPEERAAFKFAFVRHPVEWYRSWWAFQTDRDWTLRFSRLQIPACFYRQAEFSPFVERCLAEAPGFVSQLYEWYVGPPEAPIAFIGRTERLREDLATLMAERQYVYPQAIMDAMPNANVTRTKKPEWDATLRKAADASEAMAIMRFGYT